MKKRLISDFFKQITSLGSYQVYITLTLIFLLVGEIQIFAHLLIGLILIYFIGFPIRVFFFKDKPNPVKYNNFLEKASASAFPSFHSGRTGILLFILLNFFSRNFNLQLFLIILYLIILYSRIYRKKHDYYDLLGGFYLGFFVYWISKLIIQYIF